MQLNAHNPVILFVRLFLILPIRWPVYACIGWLTKLHAIIYFNKKNLGIYLTLTN